MGERLYAGEIVVAADHAGAKTGLRSPLSDLSDYIVVDDSIAQSNRARSDTRDRADHDVQFAEFAPLVRHLIGRYGDTPELCHDLPGEIYYRYCILVNDYDPDRGTPFRPYVVTQLKARTYAFARQHWRIASREARLEEAEIGCASLVDPTTTWMHAIFQEQIAARLLEAMARLPRRQRQIVIWRYYEERSFEEIAQTLGVKAATVRSLLRHGLTALRKHIGAYDVPEREP